LPCLFFLKLNSISAVRSLLDIVVVDSLNSIKNGRFLISYIFRNYNTENKIILKILTNENNPVYSIMSLYKSSE